MPQDHVPQVSLKPEESLAELLHSPGEQIFIPKLERVFGEDYAREVYRLIKAIVMRRMHSVIVWANFYLSKLDIAGIKTRVEFHRYYGDQVYTVEIKVVIEDIDPHTIKRNLTEVYKMAKLSRDEEALTRKIEALVTYELRKKAREERVEE
jgi:hypothetical protein